MKHAMRQAGLEVLAAEVGRVLQVRGWMLATAESCTGGWIAEVITAVAGSSAWFDCGFVTYSNTAKERLLGVASATLVEHGAVSEATVRAMAQGALVRSQAQIAVAVSGIAGPGRGRAEKPVGTVWIAWASTTAAQAACYRFAGDRVAVRACAVEQALRGVLRMAGAESGTVVS